MDIFRHLRFVTVSLAFSLLVGCASAPDSPPASVLPGLPEPNLTRYLTATHIPPLPPPILNPTNEGGAIPIPSPTPSTYTVASGDTLGAIAEHFGIRLADLQVANPGLVAEELRVGQTLKIPASSPESPGSFLPTPAPPQIDTVKCYPAGAGTYCLTTVYNPFPETLENVKLQITLLDSSGQPLSSRAAFLPLNILPPASALPAYVYFPAQAAPVAGAQASAQLADSIRLAPGDPRYLSAVVRNLLVSVDWDGRSARAQGQVFLPTESKTAIGAIFLVAIAYDADGQVIGFRRWEWRGSLKTGESQPFDFSVYSLGPVIEKVDTVVEAHPD